MSKRFFLLFFFLGFLFLVLFGRLFQLTIVNGSANRELADNQRLQLRKIPALRGIIYDRNLTPLVRNTPIFKNCLQKDNLCVDISRNDALKLESEGKDFGIVIESGRQYLNGLATSHLLGYLKEGIGISGIEQQYDQTLRGIDGGELIEVNTQGTSLRKIGKKEPVNGKNIVLSIEINLQKVADDALEGKKGAVVASNPNTGEILALVSSPGFDPADLEKSLKDSSLPLFNRAIGGAYPPGSTFKIITSTAGLEEKKITLQTLIEDTGVVVVGSYRYNNWYFTQYGRTEGKINIVKAIQRSNDIFFYKLGEMIGANDLISWAKKFDLGKYTGIDIPGEITGYLPDPQSGGWFLGNTYHLAIGQGALGLTPLQVNQMTATIASGGKLCRPEILSTRQPENQKTSKTDCHDIGIKPETIKIITEGMKEVCSTGGTAYPLFNFPYPIACKTGTAEFGNAQNKTHAWLTAFSLEGQNKIVVTVLVEAGGEGSAVAAPIAKKVLEEYFRK